MKQITYVRDGQVVVFENSDLVPLNYGLSTWVNARWIGSEELFATVRQQNPEVKFMERATEDR